jgi:quercetin dioxygenase-like cupin family protein
MEINRSGTRESQRGPAEHFTGGVRSDPLFEPNGVQRAPGAYVTFEPCARTDWQTHPMGKGDRHE